MDARDEADFEQMLASTGGVEIRPIIADYVQVSNGKLTVVGGGWSRMSVPGPLGIGGIVQVPPPMHDTDINVRVELCDADGASVSPANQDDNPIFFGFPLNLTPSEEDANETFHVPFAFNIPMLLIPSGDYVWRVSANGVSRDHWRLPFRMGPYEIVPLGGSGEIASDG
jgi:hypothetical protein